MKKYLLSLLLVPAFSFGMHVNIEWEDNNTIKATHFESVEEKKGSDYFTAIKYTQPIEAWSESSSKIIDKNGNGTDCELNDDTIELLKNVILFHNTFERKANGAAINIQWKKSSPSVTATKANDYFCSSIAYNPDNQQWSDLIIKSEFIDLDFAHHNDIACALKCAILGHIKVEKEYGEEKRSQNIKG